MSAVDRDGLLGAKHSNSRSYCEHLQRRRPPETADAHGAVICAEDPSGPTRVRPAGLSEDRVQQTASAPAGP